MWVDAARFGRIIIFSCEIIFVKIFTDSWLIELIQTELHTHRKISGSGAQILQLLVPIPKIKSKWNMNLVPGVLAHVQPSHPHVWQQHLGAGMSHKGPQVGGNGQLQTGGVAPVLQLIGQQLHGHGLILPEWLLQQVHRQRPKLTETCQNKGFSLYI